MCGITGIYSFTKTAHSFSHCIQKSVESLSKRGPDAQSVFTDDIVCLGHARLSILDTSKAGNQPFSDNSGRYTIIYNGEFYNYRDYIQELTNDGIRLRSTSDTEVLLYLYIKYKEACLDKIRGFFACAIYDSVEQTVFIARDRIGIKPLYILSQNEYIGFASELTALLMFPFTKQIDLQALSAYLQLNYIPAPHTILQNVTKILPGQYATISNKKIQLTQYYTIPRHSPAHTCKLSYKDAQDTLVELLHESVQLRLISDVPLGTFLSGGIDSSIISSIASEYTSNLKTFSIGFSDNPYFDETVYAQKVADRIKSNHTVISVRDSEIEKHMLSVLDSFDEPFADSSAIAVSLLSKYVKPQVTVALSGDGADELFAGYNKHTAHCTLADKNLRHYAIQALSPLLAQVPQSRNSRFGNISRKIQRYATAAKVSPAQAYLQWCSITPPKQLAGLLNKDSYVAPDFSDYTQHFSDVHSIQDVLYADQHLVLANDMLTKVDRMSMQHALEVRTPFLDHKIVSFANSLPTEYKINKRLKKSILQDAFRAVLPQELYNRPKQGFEVPLHAWCTTILQEKIQSLLGKDYIQEQGIFNYASISELRARLLSRNPGDSAAQIWALLVFQVWWKKHIQHA